VGLMVSVRYHLKINKKKESLDYYQGEITIKAKGNESFYLDNLLIVI